MGPPPVAVGPSEGRDRCGKHSPSPAPAVLLAASLASPSTTGVRVLQKHQVAGTRQVLLWGRFYLGVQTLNVWICTSPVLAPFLISDEGKEEPAFLRNISPSQRQMCHPASWANPRSLLKQQAKPRSHKWTPEPRNAPPYYLTCLFKQTNTTWLVGKDIFREVSPG